ncbi:MAG TPA: DUF2505 family protein [Kofleriaceae bacterium]|jgi:hypothetical protein|nr:DUF2505 family protein [Kofleriaceae bacterium]
MRQLTITQDINTDAARHWALYLDDAYDRAQYIDGLHYPSYELVERTETDAEIRRTTRIMPKLDLPGPVAKLFGHRFGYLEAGRFDKPTQVWTSTTTPNMLQGKLHTRTIVRVEPAGDARCKRIIELEIEAKVFAIGGLVESSLENNLRTGWAGVLAYMNKRLASG